MNFRLLMSLLMSCLFVASCNKNSSDSNGKPLSDEELLLNSYVIDVQGRIKPNKYETLASFDSYDLDEANLQKYYSEKAGNGCEKTENGKILNYSEKKVIDTDLKVGDLFEFHNAGSSIDPGISTGWESAWSESLAKIEGQRLTYHKNLLFSKDLTGSTKFDDITSYFNGNPHMVIKYDKLADKPIETKVNYSQKGLDFLNLIEAKKKSEPQVEKSYWSCHVKESKNDRYKTSLLKYELNGRFITAKLSEHTYNGKMECEKRTYAKEGESDKVLKTISFDDGEYKYSTIDSRQVKSPYLVDCRGVTIYRESLTKVNGKTISSYYEKLLKAPVR